MKTFILTVLQCNNLENVLSHQKLLNTKIDTLNKNENVLFGFR